MTTKHISRNYRYAEWTFILYTVKKGEIPVLKASFYDISEVIEAMDWKEHPLEENVLEQYHKFLLLVSKALAVG